MNTFIKQVTFIQFFIFIFSSTAIGMHSDNSSDDSDDGARKPPITRTESVLERRNRKKAERAAQEKRSTIYFSFQNNYRHLQRMLQKLGPTLYEKRDDPASAADFDLFSNIYDKIEEIYPHANPKPFFSDHRSRSCDTSVASSRRLTLERIPDVLPLGLFVERCRSHMIMTHFSETHAVQYIRCFPAVEAPSLMRAPVRSLIDDTRLTSLTSTRLAPSSALHELALLLSLSTYANSASAANSSRGGTIAEESFSSASSSLHGDTSSSTLRSPYRSPIKQADIEETRRNHHILKLVQAGKLLFEERGDSRTLSLVGSEDDDDDEVTRVYEDYQLLSPGSKSKVHHFLSKKPTTRVKPMSATMASWISDAGDPTSPHTPDPRERRDHTDAVVIHIATAREREPGTTSGEFDALLESDRKPRTTAVASSTGNNNAGAKIKKLQDPAADAYEEDGERAPTCWERCCGKKSGKGVEESLL